MCSQGTDDPKNSPYAESMNVPFLIRWPGRIAPEGGQPDALLTRYHATLLGLSGLGDRIPAEVQGRDFSPLFLATPLDSLLAPTRLSISRISTERPIPQESYATICP